MSDSTDLAGAIGTWVAVGVALFALLGVVAPILVWRAGRTERSKALAALDAGLAESAGFVTGGVRLGPNIRLFRRVRAPVLSRSPDVARKTIRWQGAGFGAENKQDQPPTESSSWVQLGHALRSYGIPFRTADVLVIEKGRAVLPVSNSWIFVLGLVGRFGHRVDEGKWPKRRPRGIQYQQAPAGHGMTRAKAPMRPPTPGWMTSRPRWADEDNDFRYNYDDRRIELYGLIGTLVVSFKRAPSGSKAREEKQDRAEISFVAHDPREVGDLGAEVLRVDQLFWLSVGCLPMRDGRVISLEDAQPMEMLEDAETEASSESIEVDWTKAAVSPTVHFDDYQHRSSHHREKRYNTSAVSPAFIISPSAPTEQHGRGRPTSRAVDTPRLFRMGVTDARAESLIGMAEMVGAEDESTETLSLEEIPVREGDVSTLKTDAQRTYVPYKRPWVRLTSASTSYSASQAWFLQRSDAQMLARALLELPICAQGALVFKSNASACRQLLVGASEALPRLLARMGSDLAMFGLDPGDSQRLGTCMWNLLTCMTPFKYTRTFSLSLYELDRALDLVCHDELIVKTAIQAVALTSSEFRDLISQSVRNIKDCMPSSLLLDFGSSTLDVPSVMGMVQKFPVDVNVLVDNPAIVDRTANRTIPYGNVILLVLKACVRSAYLQTSVDSQPLYQMVLGIDGLAHAQ